MLYDYNPTVNSRSQLCVVILMGRLSFTNAYHSADVAQWREELRKTLPAGVFITYFPLEEKYSAGNRNDSYKPVGGFHDTVEACILDVHTIIGTQDNIEKLLQQRP
jgi:hypothetical protein